MQFSGKIGQIIGWRQPLELVLSLWEILDPPLGTVMAFSFCTLFLFAVFLLLSDSENTWDILLTAKDIGLFNGKYAIFTVDLLLEHDHEFETYEHSHRGSELSHEGKNASVKPVLYSILQALSFPQNYKPSV